MQNFNIQNYSNFILDINKIENLNIIFFNLKFESFWILLNIFKFKYIFSNKQFLLKNLFISNCNNIYYIIYNNYELDDIIIKVLKNQYYFNNDFLAIDCLIYKNIVFNLYNIDLNNNFFFL
jgi:hypothetical protein